MWCAGRIFVLAIRNRRPFESNGLWFVSRLQGFGTGSRKDDLLKQPAQSSLISEDNSCLKMTGPTTSHDRPSISKESTFPNLPCSKPSKRRVVYAFV